VGNLRLFPGGTRYYKKVLSVEPGSLIGYWPQWEALGSRAEDLSGRGHHGAYTGVTLGQTGIGDGRTCPLYDGANDYTNIYSAGLAAALNPAELTLSAWFNPANVGVWTDGVARDLAFLSADANNIIDLRKGATNNLLGCRYIAGGVSKTIFPAYSAVGWAKIDMTVSVAANQLKLFINGAQVGTTQTGLGTWAGALADTRAAIGCSVITPVEAWSGNLAHVALWSKALTAAEIAYLSKV